MREVVLAFVGMIMAETAQAGLMIVSKTAMTQGMSSYIFVFYSNALASLILLPFSLAFHRSQRPQLTLPLFFSFLLLALIGCLAQFFGYAGIYYSSPTLGTAMLNLVPGFTFVLAAAFRMEKLDWESVGSVAKSVGTVISITGAFIMTFYKGLPLLMEPSSISTYQEFLPLHSKWIVGSLFLAVDCTLGSSWLILQALVLKKFPAGLVVIFYYCLFVAILSVAFCLVVENDPSAWSLKPHVRGFAVLYSAVLGSAFQLGVSVWCMRLMGPLFVAMFKPIEIIIAVAMGVTFFREVLYPGSFIGAMVIVIGFYSVMWGKSKEENGFTSWGKSDSAPSNQRAPLLQNNIEAI